MLSYIMGQTQIKDAQVRHYESMLEPSKRIFNDRYAKAIYSGGMGMDVLASWTGASLAFSDTIVDTPGYLEMVSIRTRWVDDAIVSTLKEFGYEKKKTQLVLLRARNDTRSFRLDIGRNCTVFEVDLPEMQQNKLDGLLYLDEKDYDAAARRVKRGQVKFVDATIGKALIRHDDWNQKTKTIVVMEGFTQYVNKGRTTDQLKLMYRIMPKGSKIIMTYADVNCVRDPSKCGNPDNVKNVLQLCAESPEFGVWRSGWTQEEMKEYLFKCGYQVEWDTTAKECHDIYLWKRGRKLSKEETLSMERFVVARRL